MADAPPEAHRGVRPRAQRERARPTGRLQSMLQALFGAGNARRLDNEPEPDCVNATLASTGGKVYCSGPPSRDRGAAPTCVGRNCGYYESENVDEKVVEEWRLRGERPGARRW